VKLSAFGPKRAGASLASTTTNQYVGELLSASFLGGDVGEPQGESEPREEHIRVTIRTNHCHSEENEFCGAKSKHQFIQTPDMGSKLPINRIRTQERKNRLSKRP